ncbi:helix-turn-helix domain-containing protein [Actinophytocola sediminis]
MPRTTLPDRPTITANAEGIQQARRAAGIATIGDLADAICVNRTTVHRVLGGHTPPSADFIAGTLAAFPGTPFADLFTVGRTK